MERTELMAKVDQILNEGDVDDEGLREIYFGYAMAVNDDDYDAQEKALKDLQRQGVSFDR